MAGSYSELNQYPAPIKFRIVEMDNCLNLNKHPCWDLIRDPFESEAKPLNHWTALHTVYRGSKYIYLKMLNKLIYLEFILPHGRCFLNLPQRVCKIQLELSNHETHVTMSAVQSLNAVCAFIKQSRYFH